MWALGRWRCVEAQAAASGMARRGLCLTPRQRTKNPFARFDPIADSDAEIGTLVDAYTRSGFTVNGVLMQGAVLLLPRMTTLFAVRRLEDLAPQNLDVLRVLDPLPELLIIGCGRMVTPLPATTTRWLSQHGINPELFPTHSACSTFNFMAQERRPVAAILFPLG